MKCSIHPTQARFTTSQTLLTYAVTFQKYST